MSRAVDWARLFWEANPHLPEWATVHQAFVRINLSCSSVSLMLIDRYDSAIRIKHVHCEAGKSVYNFIAQRRAPTRFSLA